MKIISMKKIIMIIAMSLTIFPSIIASNFDSLNEMFSLVFKIDNAVIDSLKSEIGLKGDVEPVGLFRENNKILLCLYFHDSHGTKVVLVDKYNRIHLESKLLDIRTNSFWYKNKLYIGFKDNPGLIVTNNSIEKIEDKIISFYHFLQQKYIQISDLFLQNAWGEYYNEVTVIGDTLFALNYDLQEVNVYSELTLKNQYKFSLDVNYSERHSEIIYKSNAILFLDVYTPDDSLIKYDLKNGQKVIIHNNDFTKAFNVGEMLDPFEGNCHKYTWYNEETFYVILYTKKGINVLKYNR